MPCNMFLALPVRSSQMYHSREMGDLGVFPDLISEAFEQSWDQSSGLGKTKQEEVSLEESRGGTGGNSIKWEKCRG